MVVSILRKSVMACDGRREARNYLSRR